jgi:DNA-directed RNA polymerase specialized sigma24 family protein
MNLPKKSNPEKKQAELMLAYICIKDIPRLNERVSILDRFDLSDSEIASVCGIAEQSVRNARQRKKHDAKKNPQKLPGESNK